MVFFFINLLAFMFVYFFHSFSFSALLADILCWGSKEIKLLLVWSHTDKAAASEYDG